MKIKKIITIFVPLIIIFFIFSINNKNYKKIEKNDIKEEEIFSPMFFENDICSMRIDKVEILDNKAKYSLTLTNKLNDDLDLQLDNLKLGEQVKKVNFKYQLNPKETKYGLMFIEDIETLQDLNNKIEAKLKINSKEYYFIFK